MTLPGHECNLPATGALKVWADDFAQKLDPIDKFLDSFAAALEFAIQNQFVDPSKMAVGGLSRGGFIALHAASREERFKYVLGFAPITDLRTVKEFVHLHEDPAVLSYNLTNISPKLIHSHVRLYIGNHDTLVDTKSCFHLAESIVKSAVAHEIKSPTVEFFLHPSIGHKGHGTPPEIFRQGADWIASCLN